MFDFVFGKNIFLGIDIGASAIKIVELKLTRGKPVLSNYAWLDLEKSQREDSLSVEEYSNFIALCLTRIIKEAKIKGRNAYVGLSSSGGLVTIISVPQMSLEDMEEAIKFEAQKYIPTSLENVVFSWTILDEISSEAAGSSKNASVTGEKEKNETADRGTDLSVSAVKSDKVSVLLVAASRNKVVAFEEIIHKSNLNLKSIEIESFPLVTSLIGRDSGNFIIIDIGSKICNIVLVEKGFIRASRNIDAGGVDITETIIRNIGLDQEKAERLKISGKDFFEGEYKIHFATLEAIVSEVNRIISTYSAKNPGFKLDNVILSGGSAKLAGLSNFLSKGLNQKVVVGNPFSRVDYNKTLEPILAPMGPRFSVALGLALGGIESYFQKKKESNFKIKIKELYLASRKLLKRDFGAKSA